MIFFGNDKTNSNVHHDQIHFIKRTIQLMLRHKCSIYKEVTKHTLVVIILLSFSPFNGCMNRFKKYMILLFKPCSKSINVESIRFLN